jgi:hypothetical protein
MNASWCGSRLLHSWHGCGSRAGSSGGGVLVVGPLHQFEALVPVCALDLTELTCERRATAASCGPNTTPPLLRKASYHHVHPCVHSMVRNGLGGAAGIADRSTGGGGEHSQALYHFCPCFTGMKSQAMIVQKFWTVNRHTGRSTRSALYVSHLELPKVNRRLNRRLPRRFVMRAPSLQMTYEQIRIPVIRTNISVSLRLSPLTVNHTESSPRISNYNQSLLQLTANS